jgi:UDPglucose 6-dehydrogenase
VARLDAVFDFNEPGECDLKVTIIGAGYVGLVTGACLAEVGNEVACLDVDAKKIEMLVSGRVPIFEPGLESMVSSCMASGHLRFTTDIEAAVDHGQFQMIAVGTPAGEDGSADLSHVLATARNIGKHMKDYKIVIDKSTVPVGTADRVRHEIAAQLKRRGATTDFSVVSNPEFLKEGAAIADFKRPDRIVIGVDDERSLQSMRQLYAPFNRNHDRLLAMDVRSAELTKYAANAMLAARISFMNELAILADAAGADIEQVRLGIGADQRIGFNFLYAGIGYGGSCLPKDIRALRNTANEHGVDLHLVSALSAVNDRQKQLIVDKVVRRFGNDLGGKRFALWGLAFKPNTDDMREAPSLEIIRGLTARNASVIAYDPIAMDNARSILAGTSRFSCAATAMEAVNGSDALIIATEWREFSSPDFATLKSALKVPVIFDGRNLYDPSYVSSFGLEYHGIGRRAPGAQGTGK